MVYNMKLNEYQNKAISTAIYPKTFAIMYPVLGLNGEAGEVAEKVKKVIRDYGGNFTSEHKQEISKELGDVLWYIAATARDLGYSLEEIAQINIDKLQARKVNNKLNGSGDNR